MTAIAARLSYFMALHDVSGADLARKTNIQPSTINKILNSKILDPRISTVQALADFFGVTTEEFLKETHSPQNQDEPTHYSLAQLTDLGDTVQSSLGQRFRVEYYAEDMAPFFSNGAILEFDKTIQPKNKDFVLALIKTDLEKPMVAFRRYLDGVTEKYLEPMNSQFKAISLKSEDQIMGVLVESYNKFL